MIKFLPWLLIISGDVFETDMAMSQFDGWMAHSGGNGTGEGRMDYGRTGDGRFFWNRYVHGGNGLGDGETGDTAGDGHSWM